LLFSCIGHSPDEIGKLCRYEFKMRDRNKGKENGEAPGKQPKAVRTGNNHVRYPNENLIGTAIRIKDLLSIISRINTVGNK